jgi:uncharacterized protein YukE
MPRAIANPEEIRRFAHGLVQNINRLRTQRANISAQFNALHDHWQDQKYAKFGDKFAHAMANMDAFLQQAEAYVHYLHRKAEMLEQYLRHSY